MVHNILQPTFPTYIHMLEKIYISIYFGLAIPNVNEIELITTIKKAMSYSIMNTSYYISLPILKQCIAWPRT